MSTAMVQANANGMIPTSAEAWGEEHMQIVRDAFAPTASPIEFMVMWAGAKSRGLDPVKKQIHFVKRWDDMRGCDVWSSQVSIDGFRAIAEATGKYDGQDEPEFSRDPEDKSLVAKVRVYRKDVGRAFVGVAMWPEFAQTKKNGDPVFMWKKMPFHMLAKCAEALALRKAFPEQLSGLYTPDEMGSSDEPHSMNGPMENVINPPPHAPRYPEWAQPIYDALRTSTGACVAACVDIAAARLAAGDDMGPAEVLKQMRLAMEGKVAEASIGRAVVDWRKRTAEKAEQLEAKAQAGDEPASDNAGGAS